MTRRPTSWRRNVPAPRRGELVRIFGEELRKEKDRFDLIEEKFPTSALAVLDFDVTRWRDIAPGEGALKDFVRPRDL